jgi:hypothetical protein
VSASLANTDAAPAGAGEHAAKNVAAAKRAVVTKGRFIGSPKMASKHIQTKAADGPLTSQIANIVRREALSRCRRGFECLDCACGGGQATCCAAKASLRE